MSPPDDEDVTASDEAAPDAIPNEDTAGTADDAPTSAEESEQTAADGQPRTAASALARWTTVALAALLAVSAALCGWLYLSVSRHDQGVGPEAQQAAMAAATDGAIALLSYSPKTLEKDFAAAERRLTGDFLSYYTDFTTKVVTPAAKEKQVQTMAAVSRKGIVTMQPDRAEVLIFVNQTTISTANPDGSYSVSSVKVGLEKHDGSWLISSFDPV